MSQSPSQARLQALPPELGALMRLNLSVTDPALIAALSEHPTGKERDDFALRALRIGVLAIGNATTMIDRESVREEGALVVSNLREAVKSHREEVEKHVNSVLAEFLGKGGDRGALHRLIEEQLTGDQSILKGKLEKQIEPLMKMLTADGENSLSSFIKGEIATLLEAEREAIQENVVKVITDKHGETIEQLDLNNEQSTVARLSNSFQKAREDLNRELSLTAEGDTALKTIRAEIDSRIKTLADAQIAFHDKFTSYFESQQTRKKERAASTLHGGDFEDELQEALNEFKGSDLLLRCGENVGLIPNSKVGDFVIEMSEDSRFAGRKIAIEAKQAQNYKDITKALSETETAIKNRGAEVGIFVLSARTIREHDEGGKSHDWDKSLQRHGNKILVIWDPEAPELNPILGAAVTLAKAMLSETHAAADDKEELEIDFALLDKSINDIEKQVERFDKMNTWADNITRDAGKVKDELAKIAKALERDAERIRDEVDTLRP